MKVQCIKIVSAFFRTRRSDGEVSATCLFSHVVHDFGLFTDYEMQVERSRKLVVAIWSLLCVRRVRLPARSKRSVGRITDGAGPAQRVVGVIDYNN